MRPALKYSAGALVIVLFGFAWLLVDWFSMNGFAQKGTCINHFGEKYECGLGEWMGRIGSPFSCIPYLLGLYVVGVALLLARRNF